MKKRNVGAFRVWILLIVGWISACSSVLIKPTNVETSPITTSVSTIEDDLQITTVPTSSPASIDETETVEDRITIQGNECLAGFHEFAYKRPPGDYVAHTDPLPPWEFVTAFPEELNDIPISVSHIETGRFFDGRQEIWIDNGYRASYLIYTPEDGNWEEISPLVDSSEKYIGQFYTTNNGEIWGEVRLLDHPPEENATLLSKFNESTRQFEFIRDVQGVLVELSNHVVETELAPFIVLDEEDVFWIFIQHDGIYSFDPKSNLVVRHIDLPEDPSEHDSVSSAVLGIDENIFFTISSPMRWSSTLYEFSIQTKTITSVDTPFGDWTAYGRLYVDAAGRLWLSSKAYKEPGQEWIVLHPNLSAYIDQTSNDYGYGASPFFTSSDGTVWFIRSTDIGYVHGTAWYDPLTGNGCQFTKIVVWNIIEDAHHTLWLMADGKIYQYTLAP